VPIPPELVTMLREHLARYGTGPDGRLFGSENGSPLQPSTWWQVWQKVRALSLTPGQLATPLLRRPYDLRHSGVTWRLNSGVPPTEVAAWAGHSVDVLMRVYAWCMTGLEDVWIARMDGTLRLEDPQADADQELCLALRQGATRLRVGEAPSTRSAGQVHCQEQCQVGGSPSGQRLWSHRMEWTGGCMSESLINDPRVARAVSNITARSERQPNAEVLQETYVESGVLPQVANFENQILFGRRGTGKTWPT
jgi:hypothetical protein